MDEYRRLAKFMDRTASWIKTKQVIALLDNLEKVARPDWGDWFRQEWPAVLSDIAAAHKEEQETHLAITEAMERTASARQVALRMKAASEAQKKNRLRVQAEEEDARRAGEEAAQREKLRKEKEEQEAAEHAAAEAQKARDEAARQRRVKALRDQELARAQRFHEEAKAIATSAGIALHENDLLAMQPEPEPEPVREDTGRVTFSNSALCGGTMIGGSNTPAAPTGRAPGFSDIAEHPLPLGQPPPPSTPPPQSPPPPHSASDELDEPKSPGYGEEATYQRSRYDAARQERSQTTPSRLVTSPRWALTGGAHGEGELVNHSSHLGTITSPTRLGGLWAEPSAGAKIDRTISRTDLDVVRRDAGILQGRMAKQYVSEVQVPSPDRRDARYSGSPRREHEQPVVEVIGVDGRRREGLSLSPRTDSSALRDAPLEVQSERLSSSSRYRADGRTLSPSRSSSRTASSVLSVRSSVRIFVGTSHSNTLARGSYQLF